MKLYKLECLTEDGQLEENGYYKKKENAGKAKKEMDKWEQNLKYNSVQNIIEIETVD
jgi:hypothetical protein